MQEIDIQEVMKNNPQVDTDELRKGQELSRRLREGGLKRAAYGLATPDERRRAIVIDSKGNRNKVHLRRSDT